MRAQRVPATLVLLLLAIKALGANQLSQRERVVHTSAINICDFSDRDSKVHCYCEHSQEFNTATKAECWVFNGGIEKSDPFWSSFASQSNIENLAFNVRSDGGLNFVPTRVIRYLRRLKQYNIKHSSITDIESFTFANITSVQEMTFTKNKIANLKPNSFYNLPNLTVLTLDENEITQLVTDTFNVLPALQKLYLTSNNITTIQGGAFRHLVNLLDLELDRNNISELNKESFNGLANLKRLDLRRNQLTVLNSFTFMELWNLGELLLDYNKIYALAQRTFDGLSELKKLGLRHNKLVTLVGGLFEGVRGLCSLDLRHNNLQRLTMDNLRPIYDNLKNSNSHLYLEGNEFECDCHLAWMHRMRHEARSVRIRTTLENFVCKLNDDPSMNSHFIYVERNAIEANSLNEEKKYYSEDPDDFFHEEIDDEDKPKVKAENERTLLQIPVETLPCPQIPKTVTERTYTHPSQNEVKDFRNLIESSSGSVIQVSVFVWVVSLTLIRFVNI